RAQCFMHPAPCTMHGALCTVHCALHAGGPMSVVMKFGGTSVGDPDAINRLLAIVRRQRESAVPVVVVSALAGVTAALVAVPPLVETGDSASAEREVRALLDRHVALASAVTSERPTELVAAIPPEVEELTGLL